MTRYRESSFDLYEISKKIKEKKEKLDLKLENLQFRESERERVNMIAQNEERKKNAQIYAEDFKREEQRKRDQLEYDKSDAGRTEAVRLEAEENRRRWRKMGYTEEQIRVHKGLSPTERVRHMNKVAQDETNGWLENTNLSKFKTKLKDLVNYKPVYRIRNP